jgi:hypothetical protein
MRVSKIIVTALVLVFALSLFTVAAPASMNNQEPKKPEPKQQQKENLPKEVKAIIQEGLATRQGRQDIPFTIFKSMYFPAPGGMHTVIFFKAKNGDLGYAAPLPASAPPKNQAAQPAAPAAGTLEARLAMAFEFYQTDETGAQKVSRYANFPVTLQTDAAGYDPNKEEWYSLGFGLPCGKYTVAMLIAAVDPKKGTADIKRVGVQYYDVTLPGPETYQNALQTTPLFLVRHLDQMTSYEARPVVHKGSFTYSILQMVPIIDGIVTAEDQAKIEVFFIVLGAKPKEGTPQGQQPAEDLEVTFEVQKEDGSPAIKWQAQNYASQLIDQELPLQQTLQIKDDKGERQERKPLSPGKYVLVAKILDKVSQLTLEKKEPFELK